MVLFWIISNAGKKKTSPRSRQLWDEARRRQPMPPIMEEEREVPRPIFEQEQRVPPPLRPFPGLEDLGKEIKEVFENEFFPEEKTAEETFAEKTVTERKKIYRLKHKPYHPSVTTEEVGAKETTPAIFKEPDTGLECLSLSTQGLVQGIIMSEILQPPRSRRPLRH